MTCKSDFGSITETQMKDKSQVSSIVSNNRHLIYDWRVINTLQVQNVRQLGKMLGCFATFYITLFFFKDFSELWYHRIHWLFFILIWKCHIFPIGSYNGFRIWFYWSTVWAFDYAKIEHAHPTTIRFKGGTTPLTKNQHDFMSSISNLSTPFWKKKLSKEFKSSIKI